SLTGQYQPASILRSSCLQEVIEVSRRSNVVGHAGNVCGCLMLAPSAILLRNFGTRFATSCSSSLLEFVDDPNRLCREECISQQSAQHSDRSEYRFLPTLAHVNDDHLAGFLLGRGQR